MSQAQWQEMFQGVFTNGVMNGQLGGYVVTVTSGLGISVATGKAIIQGFYARSDAAVPLTAGAADPTNPRIDLAVLHADLSAHTLTVQLLAGTPAPSPSPPALTQTSTVWEIALYQVRVNAAQTVLTSGSLTDIRQYFGIGGVGIDYLASITAAQLWAPQSGAANWFEFITWNGSALKIPLGLGSAAAGHGAGAYFDDGGNLTLFGAMSLVGGQATVGGFGVPVIVAQAVRTAVAVTTLQTILTYSVPANGTYRVSFNVQTHNGTAGWKPLCKISFTDADGVADFLNPLGQDGNGNGHVFDGIAAAIALAAGDYVVPINPIAFDANVGTMTCQYQATGTPNDKVTVIVERLA